MNRWVRALCFLIVAAAAPVSVAQCPALDGLSSLHRSEFALRELLRSPEAQTPACTEKAEIVLSWLDRPTSSVCPIESGWDSPDPDVWAFESALDWRCGRAESAFQKARRAAAEKPNSTLAWLTLGKVFLARFRSDVARTAFERALEAHPESCDALWYLAGLSKTREIATRRLTRYLDQAAACGESLDRRRSANQRIGFLDALEQTPVWVVDEMELPAEIKLRPWTTRPPNVGGWNATCRLGKRDNVRVLVDSGASGLHIAENIARKSGIEALSRGTLIGGGGDRKHEVSDGILETIDFGPISFKQPIARVAEGSLHSSGAFQAIVGVDVFDGLEVSLDANKGGLQIVEAEGWTDESTDPLTVDPWVLGSGWSPLLRVEGQLLARAEIEGETYWGVLDTGAALSLVALDLAPALTGFRHGSRRRVNSYGGRRETPGSLVQVEIVLHGESTRLREIPAIDLGERSRVTGFPVSGLWGLDQIKRRTITFDLARGAFRIAR